MESSPALDPTPSAGLEDAGAAAPDSGSPAVRSVSELRRRTAIYLFATAAAAAALCVMFLSQMTPISSVRLGLAVAMVGFMIVAWLFPLPFAFQTKLYLDTSVIFASILLFDPGVAMIVAASGTAIAHLLRRRSPSEAIFNTSQTAIQAAFGGMVLALGGWSVSRLAFNSALEILMIALAGVTIYFVNTVLVAGVIALQTSVDPFKVWRESTSDTTRTDILSHLSQIGIGLIAAITADAQPWSIVLLVLPSVTIYTSFSRHLQIRNDDAEKLRGAEQSLAHAQQEAVRHAGYDHLTGLPNRRHLIETLELTLADPTASVRGLALLIVDVDRFKVVNDSLGHTSGDRLLAEFAARLRHAVPGNAGIARLGADEFAVLIPGDPACTPNHPGNVAQSILNAFVTPFAIDDRDVYLTASIGIAQIRTDHQTPVDLLRDADVALFLAKQRGKARYEVFDAEAGDFTPDRVGLETDLRRAIERHELKLLFQPIVALRSGRIEGFEALVRWHHPQRGVVPPSRFIPLAEETGLIVPLGHWVLMEACRQAKIWQDRYKPSAPSISVNLSGRQFHNPHLVAEVAQALSASGLNPHALRLEITESVIMDDADSAIDVLRELKALGVEIAIDDFGTGYSSLAYLRRFPVDHLKVDRSFIAGLGRSSEDTTITQAVVSLGHALSMTVIAEGIETIGQVVHLCSIDCELGQGNHFAEPVAARDAEALLTSETLSLQPVLSLPLHLAPTVA